MSINDLEDDGTFTKLIDGDGYSLVSDGEKVRADVWTEGRHIGSPWRGRITIDRCEAAVAALVRQFRDDSEGLERSVKLAFEMGRLLPPEA